jgi:hypothetical protein
MIIVEYSKRPWVHVRRHGQDGLVGALWGDGELWGYSKARALPRVQHDATLLSCLFLPSPHHIKHGRLRSHGPQQPSDNASQCL